MARGAQKRVVATRVRSQWADCSLQFRLVRRANQGIRGIGWTLSVPPPSVALSRWKANRPARVETTPVDVTRHAQHVSETGRLVETPTSGGVLTGSIILPLHGSANMQPRVEEDRSEHLLDPERDGLSCLLREEDSEGDTPSNLGSGDTEGMELAPPRFVGGDMVMVSLSAGSEDATCPTETGGMPCTPCTPVEAHNSLDVLCTQLRRALTPILAQVANREVAAPKRRPRQRRHPVSNPRRSVRVARGTGRGSSATKQQNVLIRKLCLANEGEVITDEALQAYVKLFERPLTDMQVKAILALFGWEPEVLPLLREEAVVDQQ